MGRRGIRKEGLTELLSEIAAKKKEQSQLELIIGLADSAKARAEKELARLGEIRHIFSRVPYLSIRCLPYDAEQLVGSVSGRSRNRSFNTSFGYSLAALRSLELSHTFSISLYRKEETKPSGRLWNLDNIGCYDAWKISRGDGSSVAVIDSGVDYNHPALCSCFGSNKGVDIVDGGDPLDPNGHGTHVAGIIAGAYTDVSDSCGVAPAATLYTLRVLGADGYGLESDVMAGIEWALDNSVDIANLSLGARAASGAFRELCSLAYKEGLLMVAAAGNDGFGAEYPAAFGESVLGIAALDKFNQHPGFSNIYSTNDLSAPGVGVYSTIPGGYASYSGTSMATPH
ncbi:TPA: S8 family serine peptidase, partial [Candidatus Woesearchaeota archaeon]|nr:S8 family serine peptidase [Candidatus Woesearchaeota archaeon]